MMPRPPHRLAVRLLAATQVLLLTCAVTVQVARHQRANPARISTAATAAYIVETAVTPIKPTASVRTEKRTSRATKRQAPVRQAKSAARPTKAGARLQWPVRGMITSPFGPRGKGFHHGTDIGCGMGWDIRAARGGRIVAIGDGKAYGNAMLIDHGDGYITLYAHFSAFAVEYGDTVRTGQVIGACGETGRATGPHLHFEVRYGGYVWDPIDYLP